jgi:hypothetical protein
MKSGFEMGGYGLVAGGPRLHSIMVLKGVHADDARSIRGQAMGRTEKWFFSSFLFLFASRCLSSWLTIESTQIS